MLCEFLAEQDNIECEFELLQRHKEKKYLKFVRRKGRSQYSFSKLMRILGPDESQHVKNRNNNFEEYLKQWEEGLPSKYFGFKIFFRSHLSDYKVPTDSSISYDRFLKYIKDNNIKIIHLTRDNLLLKYISVLTSNKIGTFSSSILQNQHGLVTVDVDYHNFIKYSNNLIIEENNVIDFCKSNNIEYHHVTYENLTSDKYQDFYKQIFEFLGEPVENFKDIKGTPVQRQTKRNIYTLKEKIANYDELLQAAVLNCNTDLQNILKEI
jgi:hypothetical protein